jgi:hypothetical protein
MWPNNTRQFFTDLGAKAGPLAGGAVTFDVPRVGILSSIHLMITGTVGGTVNTPNPLGFSAAVSSVVVQANSGLQLVSLSGPGYHYLLRDQLEMLTDVASAEVNGRTAVTAAAFDDSMFIPIAINSRDPIGLINLQNEDTLLQIVVNFATPVVTGGSTATFTALSAQPFLELFSMPINKDDMPRFDYAHTITEEQESIAGAGVYTKNWLRGNIYLEMLHGVGIAVAPSDAFSTAQVRVDQNRFLYPNITPAFADKYYAKYRGRARLKGVLPIDFFNSSGLGNYASMRDAIDSAQLTDLSTLITATGAVTLYSTKRQLVKLGQAPGR